MAHSPLGGRGAQLRRQRCRRHRPGFDASDSDAKEAQGRKWKRSELACFYYPAQHASVAGSILFNLINDIGHLGKNDTFKLKRDMYAVGYEPNKKGYSARMVEILNKYMKQHYYLKDINNAKDYVSSKFKDKIKDPL